MAVDEPRQRGCPAGVDPRTLDALGYVPLLADPGHTAALDRDRRVAHDAEHPAPGGIVRDELADVLDEHYVSVIGMRTPRSAATALASS